MQELSESALSFGAEKASDVVWKEKVAKCFKQRKFLGRHLQAIAIDGVFVSPPIVSCFQDYELVCRLGEGKTCVLYGANGSGKTSTLMALAAGMSPWAPERAIFIGGDKQATGNEFARSIGKLLENESYFPDEMNAFATDLVGIAKSQSLVERTSGYCCDSTEDVDAPASFPIKRFHRTPSAEFDKKPVIVIDNINFSFKEGDELHGENHVRFWTFVSNLYDEAASQGVAVFLATPNKFIAQALAVLNAGRIEQAKASKFDSTADHEDVKSVITCVDFQGEETTLVWRSTLGWTTKTVVTHLKQHFPSLSEDDAMYVVAEKRTDLTGDIRAALAAATEFAFPPLANSTTNESNV